MRDVQALVEYRRRVELLRREVVVPYPARLEKYSLFAALGALLYWLSWAI